MGSKNVLEDSPLDMWLQTRVVPRVKVLLALAMLVLQIT